MAKKGRLTLLDGEGGIVLDSSSDLARRVKKVLREGLKWNPEENVLDLYLEDDVYNFYLRDEAGSWQKFNYDTGCAMTVFPRGWKQQKSETPATADSHPMEVSAQTFENPSGQLLGGRRHPQE